MSRMNDEERELKVVYEAISYWKGFIDALKAIQNNTIEPEKQISYAEDMIDEYSERLKKLRKRAKK
jgi:hypothetical protein